MLQRHAVGHSRPRHVQGLDGGTCMPWSITTWIPPSSGRPF